MDLRKYIIVHQSLELPISGLLNFHMSSTRRAAAPSVCHKICATFSLSSSPYTPLLSFVLVYSYFFTFIMPPKTKGKGRKEDNRELLSVSRAKWAWMSMGQRQALEKTVTEDESATSQDQVSNQNGDHDQHAARSVESAPSKRRPNEGESSHRHHQHFHLSCWLKQYPGSPPWACPPGARPAWSCQGEDGKEGKTAALQHSHDNRWWLIIRGGAGCPRWKHLLQADEEDRLAPCRKYWLKSMKVLQPTARWPRVWCGHMRWCMPQMGKLWCMMRFRCHLCTKLPDCYRGERSSRNPDNHTFQGPDGRLTTVWVGKGTVFLCSLAYQHEQGLVTWDD